MARGMRDSGVAWIGEMPKGWGMNRLKFTADCFDGKRVPIDASQRRVGPYPYWGAGSIQDYVDDYIFDEELVLLGEDGAPFFDNCRDVAFLVKGKIWVNNHIHVLKAKSVCTNQYLCYTLNVVDYSDYVSGSILLKLTQGRMREIVVPLPPLPEQRAITDYLDEKCGAIDAAIAEAKKGIEEYKAWKTSLIDDVVCNGIVRRDGRKETGEVWLADIPDEWEFTQIRYLFALRDERNDKPLKDVNLISLYTDKGVVQHSDLEKTTGNKASTADGYKLVYENDIVVNIILCWMGAVGRSAYNGVTSPAYDVYRPIDPTKVLSRYYHYLFRTPRFNGKCYEEGRGIMMMRWRTYSSEFRAIKVPVPPIEEQQAIADYLDEKCAAIAAMVAEKEALIADLEAYKKSLIYETVTGKRKVA